MQFRDRSEAGRALGAKLEEFANRQDVVVLALPRGGVPVGYEVAHALGAPLDVFVVRKLGTPGQEELAMGAIASGGVRMVNESVVKSFHLSPEQVEAVVAREAQEVERREQQYGEGRKRPEVRDRTVILVDDGLATGATMRTAVAALRAQGPKAIIVAVPVGARSTCELLAREADELVCLVMPRDFFAVGQWYREFPQTSDAEVRELLERAAGQPHQAA